MGIFFTGKLPCHFLCLFPFMKGAKSFWKGIGHERIISIKSRYQFEETSLFIETYSYRSYLI